MYKCLIDGREFETKNQLHNYVSRRLKIKIDAYYKKHVPREDRLTGEPIEFKNEEFYLNSIFNNRKNLIEYIKKYPKDIETIEEVFIARRDTKNLVYAPSTVETRTSILPTPFILKKYGINYERLCRRLNLKSKYDYDAVLKFEKEKPLTVLADNREQLPIQFNCEVVKTKIDFGDYTTSSHYRRVFIERKSLSDFCGTLSQGFERLQREFQRAKDMDCHIVVCVEEPLKNLINLQLKHTKASSEFLCKRMRGLCQSFDNVQFLFTNSREEMSGIIQKIFRLENDVSELDLQFCYDSNLFQV